MTVARRILPTDVMPGNVSVERRIEVTSAGAYLLPQGWISIIDIGPFLLLEKWSVNRQMWLPTKMQKVGIIPCFYSTGASHRVVNNMNCAAGVIINAVGSGYSSGTPPVLSTTRAGTNGLTTTIARFRCLVGGAIALSLSQGGQYKYPPCIVFDYSQQTPPFREATIGPVLNSSGAITGFQYEDNSIPTAGGSGPIGAGLNASTLGVSIVRHPDDPYSSDASVSINQAGSGTVTAVDCIDYGGAIGDNDFNNTSSITHNGGSGFAASIIGNFYMTGITISAGGSYTDTSDVALTSSTANDTYAPIFAYSYLQNDEASRPYSEVGVAIFSAGALSNTNAAMGPGFQQKPKLVIGYNPRIKVVTPATIAPRLGKGGDYFSYQILTQ